MGMHDLSSCWLCQCAALSGFIPSLQVPCSHKQVATYRWHHAWQQPPAHLAGSLCVTRRLSVNCEPAADESHTVCCEVPGTAGCLDQREGHCRYIPSHIMKAACHAVQTNCYPVPAGCRLPLPQVALRRVHCCCSLSAGVV
jgi:hypothetical protein